MGTGVGRHFELHRDQDVSGVSGEGVVAEGWQYDQPMTLRFPDGGVLHLEPGWCVVRWKSEHASTVFWHNVEDAVAVHGHDGATRFVWTDKDLPTTGDLPVRERPQFRLEFRAPVSTPEKVGRLKRRRG